MMVSCMSSINLKQTNKKIFGDVVKRMVAWPEFIQIGIANLTILKKIWKKCILKS